MDTILLHKQRQIPVSPNMSLITGHQKRKASFVENKLDYILCFFLFAKYIYEIIGNVLGVGLM